MASYKYSWEINVADTGIKRIVIKNESLLTVYSPIIQDVDEFISSSELFCENVALYHLLINGMHCNERVPSEGGFK